MIRKLLVLVLSLNLMACGASSELKELQGVVGDINDIFIEVGNNVGTNQEVKHNLKYGSHKLQYGIAIPKGQGFYEIRFADKDNIGFYNYCQKSFENNGYWNYYKEINVGIRFDVDSYVAIKQFSSTQGYAYTLGSRAYSKVDLGSGSYQILKETETQFKGTISTRNLTGSFIAYKCSAKATAKRLEEVQWTQGKTFDLKSKYNSQTQGKLKFKSDGLTYGATAEIEFIFEHLERPSYSDNNGHNYESDRFYTSRQFYLLGEKIYSCNRTPVGTFSNTKLEFNHRDLCDDNYEKSIGIVKLEHSNSKDSIEFLYNDVGQDKYVISK